ncbi:hypothetical protein [Acrocarpospora corrugata]|nr:hypothetical protein [Acrocarpospora corrugata]
MRVLLSTYGSCGDVEPLAASRELGAKLLLGAVSQGRPPVPA